MNLKEQLNAIRASGNRIPVAVLGASGMVGQVFTAMLADHPWFELKTLCASDQRAGVAYGQTVNWQIPLSLPRPVQNMPLTACALDTVSDTPIIFSALPRDIAAELEPRLAENGHAVFTNAGALRMRPDVPILIPDANPEALDCIHEQGFPERGFVITNPNCAVTGLACALTPLKKFGIRDVHVSTCQSISGAGYPGLSAMDMTDNLLPHIAGEEEKIAAELDKILNIQCETLVTCVRVPVRFGHLETVWIRLEDNPSEADILAAWDQHRSPELPNLPHRPVRYRKEPDQPQPRLSFSGEPRGMTVFTGRLRKKGDRIGFVLLVNNIVKGAAGGSIANAELFVKTEKLKVTSVQCSARQEYEEK